MPDSRPFRQKLVSIDKFLETDILTALGAFPACTVHVAGGRNRDVDSATPETVWETGGLYLPLTGAEEIRLVSTSADDDAAGLGVQEVLVEGLPDWDSPEEELLVETDGLTEVVLSDQFCCINHVTATRWGTAFGTASGNITLTAQGSARVLATIPAGANVHQSSVHGTPRGSKAIIRDAYAGIRRTGGGSVNVDFELILHSDPENEGGAISLGTVPLRSTVSTFVSKPWRTIPAFPGPCVFYILADASADNTDVVGAIDILTVRTGPE